MSKGKFQEEFTAFSNPREVASHLREKGAVLIRLLDFDDPKAAAFRDQWIEERRNAPELKEEEQGKHDSLVLAKFGADGHPSAYHNKTTLKLRGLVMKGVERPLSFYHGKKKEKMSAA